MELGGERPPSSLLTSSITVQKRPRASTRSPSPATHVHVSVHSQTLRSHSSSPANLHPPSPNPSFHLSSSFLAYPPPTPTPPPPLISTLNSVTLHFTRGLTCSQRSHSFFHCATRLPFPPHKSIIPANGKSTLT